MRRGHRRTAFPGAEIPPHDQVIERNLSNELEQLGHDLLHDALLHIIALQALPNLIDEVQNIVHARGGCSLALNALYHPRKHSP